MATFNTTLELWNSLKEDLKSVFSADIYDTWFQPLQCVDEPFAGKLSLSTNTDFACMWLQNNYQGIFEKKLFLFKKWSAKIP